MVAVQPAPARPPANIEDFLWNVHSVLVATPGPLALDNLKETYSKHFGHKCTIERFLVVGEGGLAVTLKRIPHIVNLFQEGGATCVKAAQPPDISKQQLIEADAQYRRELLKKNAANKALAANNSKAKAKAVAGTKVAGVPSVPTATPEGKAASPLADGQAKRAAEVPAAAGGDKKPRTDSDADTLARMLVQGVVRVLQNRAKANKGPLPMSELEEEFKALWKVPFNLQQAGEQDPVTFLQKWPNKVELYHDGSQHMLQLPKKMQEKAKAGAPPTEPVQPPAAKRAGEAPPPAVKAAATAGVAPPAAAVAAGKAAVPPKPSAVAASGAAAAAKPPVAAKAVPAPTAAPAAPGPSAAAAKPAADASATAAKSGPSIPKRPGGPTRAPASIEDFLWNIHSVIEAYGGPMPLDQLKEAYSKHLGHRCGIERFLVVGDGGLAATLRRIPHIVVSTQEKEGGPVMLKPALPPGTTKEQLIAADHQYRRQLQQKNAAAKARQPAAPGPTTATGAAAAPTAAAAATGEKRPAETAAGEAAAKRARTEDGDTLARMLVQGIIRLVQNRQRDGKGPVPVSSLEEEFKALWKVPFNLAQAGETDTVTFLQKWPNKVEVVHDGTQQVVQLAKKFTEKAKSAVPTATKAAAPAAATAPSSAGTDGEAAKKAAPVVAAATPPKPSAAAGSPKASPPAKAAAVSTALSPQAASTPAAQATPPAPAAASAPASTAPAAGRSPATVQKEAAKDAAPATSTDGGAEAAAAPAGAEEEAPPQASEEAAGDGGELEAAETSVRAAETGLSTLPEIREEAESVLQAMRELVQKQEVLVSALRRLGLDETGETL